jgi:hypothetical protein
MRFFISLEADSDNLTGRERTSKRTFYLSDEILAFGSFDVDDVIVFAVLGFQMRRKNHKFAACKRGNRYQEHEDGTDPENAVHLTLLER